MIEFDYLETHLVDHCNLNCSKCSHYSPIAKPRYYDVAQFKKEMSQIAFLTKNINHKFVIRLMGGEPLLHPNFLDFCKITRELFPNAEIWIVSNGLLLKNQNEQFYNVLNENKIGFSFTHYKGSPNFDDYSILYDLAKFDISWVTEHSGFMCTDLNFAKQDTDIFKLCSDNYSMLCTLLKDGKLYKCAIEAYNFNLKNKFNIQFPEDYNIQNNELDIYNCTYEQIIEFLNKPSTFCRYCNWCIKPHVPWQQSKQELNEWVENSNGI